jgi:hypothetical protein
MVAGSFDPGLLTKPDLLLMMALRERARNERQLGSPPAPTAQCHHQYNRGGRHDEEISELAVPTRPLAGHPASWMGI